MYPQESLWKGKTTELQAQAVKLTLNRVRNKDTYFLLAPPHSWGDPLGCELPRGPGGLQGNPAQVGDPALETWWERGEGGGREPRSAEQGQKFPFQTKLGSSTLTLFI